jgi:hypothetical protein
VLDPFKAARGQIRRRSQDRLISQEFKRNVGDLERVGRLAIRPAANGKHLAADLSAGHHL